MGEHADAERVLGKKQSEEIINKRLENERGLDLRSVEDQVGGKAAEMGSKPCDSFWKTDCMEHSFIQPASEAANVKLGH